ncbi:MAG: hypothetical protein CL613_06020 [Aquimarina sp.]|nr:hypothetical protein [Aquimarina sp.]
MIRLNKLFIKKPFLASKSICLLFAIAFIPFFQSFAQNDVEQVKRLQRAIFIFNFSQQIGWDSLDDQETFKIGVLGNDRTIIDLKTLAQKRKIHNKPVEIIQFDLVKNIRNVNVVYVNKKYNYNIKYVRGSIEGRNILLISEDYEYNSSMINMVSVGESFLYEINKTRLKSEGFNFKPSLADHAVSTSDKWKELYQNSEESLNIEKAKVKEQQLVIEDKQQEIKEKEDALQGKEDLLLKREQDLKNKTKQITNLNLKNNLQKKQFEEKLTIEKKLEDNIREQLDLIKAQEDRIALGNADLIKQQKKLENQKAEIEAQSNTLKNQKQELNLRRNFNILLAVVLILLIILGLIIYREYRIKNRLNKELQVKNKEIFEQSQELISKNQELEQFAYIASHDLQEPLNTISSFIGLISEDYGDSFDEMGQESLNFIQDASIRMKKLIDALLQYSRLGRNSDKININLNLLLSELEADLKAVIEKTKANIVIEDLHSVNGVPIEIRLLFQNLISNAIKFVEKDVTPIIKIASKKVYNESNEERIQFAVEDNGIGIPEEHQDRIFAIFQRLHTRDKYEGTGIGLAHCKKIVESHGGNIWLESQVGKGTTFYFTLPLQT